MANLIGEILGAVIVVAIGYLTPIVRRWFVNKIGEAETQEVFDKISLFVRSAEQIYKEKDPDGSQRKAYVKMLVENAGISYTEEINAFIEALVYEINRS